MPKMPVSKKSENSFKYSVRSKDLPATQGIMHLVRNELKADIRGFRAEVDARFNQVDARFSQVDARFSQVDARFNQVDAKLEMMHSEISRIATMVEEQNSRNCVVLEGLQSLWQRQERVEGRMDQVERTVRSIAGSRT